MNRQRLSRTGIIPLREVKKAAILAAVQQLNGNIPLAAEKLEIATPALYRKLREYGALQWQRRTRSER